MAIFKIFVIDFKNGRKKKTPQKMQTNEGGGKYLYKSKPTWSLKVVSWEQYFVRLTYLSRC